MARWCLRAIVVGVVLSAGWQAGAQTADAVKRAEPPLETGAIRGKALSPEADAAPAVKDDGGDPEAARPGDGSAGESARAPAPVAEPTTPFGVTLKARLTLIPDTGTDADTKERTALIAFYGARGYAPLWTDDKGFKADASAVAEVFSASGDWGLDAADFAMPKLEDAEAAAGHLSPEAQAEAEVALSIEVLRYARFARGGRIAHPAEQLNSNLDRKPQLLAPEAVLEGLAAAQDKAAYLVGTHPQHPQFQRLREKYVAALAKSGGRQTAATKRLRANMEMWRWMWADLGDMHLMANVPAYMIDVVKDGKTVRSERVVVGEIGKQSSIFTRRLQDITFRPMWRVPESIKVNELWPSLLRGGGLMRQYGLEVETKAGRRLDWRTMDWRNLDIRDYEVVQPAGRKSVMGYVKFSFPSQHTIFMHDTPDKWMFNARQRTLSHGCLRLRNPLSVAALVLAHDKGWDEAKVQDLAKTGPYNNAVAIEKRIPMHIAYFTAWVDDAGTLKTYSDIYGHEKRVTQALDGKWNEIRKGRDHLTPPVPSPAHVAERPRTQKPSRVSQSANDDFFSNLFGGF